MEDLHNWQDKFTTCEYSARLLNKLASLNSTANRKVDITEITKAIYYAKKYHGEQKRQSGEPYYSHPLEVAYMVSEYLFSTEAIIVSILHDTIEDTKLTEKDIEELFDATIAKQVESLTRIKNGVKITSEELIERLWLEGNHESLVVKLFDRLHNMQTIGAKSPEKIKKIVAETINSFIVLSAYLDIREIEKKLANTCLEVFNESMLYLDTPFGTNQNLLDLLFGNGVNRKKI